MTQYEEPSDAVDVSVIVTVVEHPVSLVQLFEEFSAPLSKAGHSFEFVFAAHPSFHTLMEPLSALARGGAPIRLIEVGQAVGETTLLKLAAEIARGRVLVTLPAYFQVEASALPALVAQVEAGADLAVAQRWPRIDSRLNRLQSRVLHWMIGPLMRGQIHDVACGVRAIRPVVLRDMTLYGDFARFLPLLALRDGFRVQEVQSPVHASAMRARVYAPGVYLRRLIDVFGLTFLLRFTEKPLRFFGLVGITLALPGSAILFVVLVQRLGGQGAADRPLMLLGMVLLVLGVQAIALGLIGEMIVHLNASRRRSYRLRSPEAQPGNGPRDTASLDAG